LVVLGSAGLKCPAPGMADDRVHLTSRKANKSPSWVPRVLPHSLPPAERRGRRRAEEIGAALPQRRCIRPLFAPPGIEGKTSACDLPTGSDDPGTLQRDDLPWVAL
jgi:hypothetical protein